MGARSCLGEISMVEMVAALNVLTRDISLSAFVGVSFLLPAVECKVTLIRFSPPYSYSGTDVMDSLDDSVRYHTIS